VQAVVSAARGSKLVQVTLNDLSLTPEPNHAGPMVPVRDQDVMDVLNARHTWKE
jgi:hypothetical protein